MTLACSCLRLFTTAGKRLRLFSYVCLETERETERESETERDIKYRKDRGAFLDFQKSEGEL